MLTPCRTTARKASISSKRSYGTIWTSAARIVVFGLAGFSPQPGAEPPSESTRTYTVYQSNFDDRPRADWFTYQAGRPAPVQLKRETDHGNSHLVSEGPWWPDPNHESPGLGRLHILAFAYHDSHRFTPVEGPGLQPVDLGNGQRLYADKHPSTDGDESSARGRAIARGPIAGPAPGERIDLRGARISFRMQWQGAVVPPGTQLYFWFQAWDPHAARGGRFVNYVLTARPLFDASVAGHWTPVLLNLTPDESAWSCLGSSTARESVYGCSASVSAALARFDHNLGFVALLPGEIGEGAAFMQGRFLIDDLRIEARRPVGLAKRTS